MGAGDLRLVDEFLKERAEVDHGLAQIFGVGLALGLAESALMRGAVIFEDERMVHGNIVGALFEIADGITAGGHHVGEQLVGVGDGAAGAVNEAGLDFGPGICEAGAVAGAKWTDVAGVRRARRVR